MPRQGSEHQQVVIARYNDRRTGGQRQLEVFIVLHVAAIGDPFHGFEHQSGGTENVENAAADRIREISTEFRTLQYLADFGLDRRR